jgi:glutaredoxin 3
VKVTVYSSPTCGVCTAVKHYLKYRNVAYREYDVSRDTDALQEMVDLTGGAHTVPVVAVDGQPVVGFNRERLDTLLGIES